MHRLQTFMIEIVLPNLSSLSEKVVQANTGLLAMKRREVIESVLWLDLGVECGIFPEEPARALYNTYFQPFFTSMLSKEATIVEGPEYVAHSEESRALVIEMSRYTKTVVEKAMRGEDIFGGELLGLENATALRGLCQTLLLLYTDFARQLGVRKFTYTVSFAPDDEWSKIWAGEITPEAITDAHYLGTDSDLALTFAGYLALWGFGSRCRETMRYVEGRDGVPTGDLFRVRDRLREITEWRVNLRRGSAVERFSSIQSKIDSEISKESQLKGVSPDAATLIRASVEEALETLGMPVLTYA